MQAAEVVKWGMGVGTLLTNRILTIDLLRGRMREVPVPRSRTCPLCGDTPAVATTAGGAAS